MPKNFTRGVMNQVFGSNSGAQASTRSKHLTNRINCLNPAVQRFKDYRDVSSRDLMIHHESIQDLIYLTPDLVLPLLNLIKVMVEITREEYNKGHQVFFQGTETHTHLKT